MPWVLLALAFLARLGWTRWWAGPEALYFADSAAHLVHGRLTAQGLARAYPWPVHPRDLCNAGFEVLGLSPLDANLATHVVFAALALALFSAAAKRLYGARAALAAGLLLVSLPAFPKLVFSAQPELAAFGALGLAVFLSTYASPWAAAGAVLVLCGAFWRRPEAGVYLAGYAACAAWTFRRRPALAVGLAALALWGVSMRWGGAMQHATRLMPSQVLDPGVSAATRWLGAPRYLVMEMLPFSALLGFALARGTDRLWPALAAAQAAALLLAGGFGLLSLEFERVWLAALALGVLGASPLVAKMPARNLGLLGALTLFLYWRAPRAPEATLPAATVQAREAGRTLRGIIGDVEIAVGELPWPDVLVFSGQYDRLSLLPSPRVEWGAPLLAADGDPDVLVLRAEEPAPGPGFRTLWSSKLYSVWGR